jgi:DNA modification methylase
MIKGKNYILNLKYDEVIKYADKVMFEMNSTNSLFILFENEYRDGEISHDFFDIIEYYVSKGFQYVNTIIVPRKPHSHEGFIDNVLYVLWFVKNKKDMIFLKDNIREKHIWKDVEWGKRKKNYNPLGKDPGNVWIPTEDNGKGRITKHIYLNIDEVIERIKKSLNPDCETIIYKDDKQNRFMSNDNNKELKNIHLRNDNQVLNSEKREMKADVIFNSSEKMKFVFDESVKSIITSPPYWDLKDYYKKGQIGQETYEKYLSRLNKVWSEAYRVLKSDGTLWININVRTKKNIPILIPNDIIKQCKKIGFIYRGIIIWHKSSGIPTNKNNLVDRHEYVLYFSKNENNYIDKMNEFNDYLNDDINQGCIWNINRKAGSVGKGYKHPAIYPVELVNRLIKISSEEGDTILDPFLGSGTSLIASINMNRNFIGYEYYEGFEKLIKYRIDNELQKNFKFKIFKN